MRQPLSAGEWHRHELDGGVKMCAIVLSGFGGLESLTIKAARP